MRRIPQAACIFLVLLIAPLLHGDPAVLSLQEYAGALEQLHAKLAVSDLQPDAAAAIANELPSAYTVQSEGRSFVVSNDEIKKDLTQFAKSHDTAALTQARGTLDLLFGDVQAMNMAPTSNEAEHAKLDEILARKEFRGITETWWDRLKRRLQQYLWEWLAGMLTSESAPVVGRVLLWGLIVATVALLALWVIRNYRESVFATNFTGAPGTISERPWRDWQREARLAAQEGRWRDAIHLSYWAGISFLEGQGLWRPDRARTPREYLRLLPADDVHRKDLTELTRSFETVWYGSEAAGEPTFAATNALLERLGCR